MDCKGSGSGSSVAQQIAPQIFTLTELSSATKKFNPYHLVDVQRFATIYKGRLHPNNQLVAVKKFITTEEDQEIHKFFLVETLTLANFHHENIINIHGYCSAENHRIIVLEKAALHPLKNFLFSSSSAINKCNFRPLDWSARIKIALGVAKGLDYLHNKVSPPIIHRDLHTSNIVLGEDLTPKISNFELAKLGPIGDRKHLITRVVGTSGFLAPEYGAQGLVSVKLDVYMFGVFLLELITGRRVSDIIRVHAEHDLASWVEAVAKDARMLIEMADPILKGEFQIEDLKKMFQISEMCLQAESENRPLATDVVSMLSTLLVISDDGIQIQPQVLIQVDGSGWVRPEVDST